MYPNNKTYNLTENVLKTAFQNPFQASLCIYKINQQH